MDDYWRRQSQAPLFADLIWDRPERRDLAKDITVVGGSSSGFNAVAMCYETLLDAKMRQIRVILPDSLRAKLPTAIRGRMDDLIFAPSNKSGGLAKASKHIIDAACDWSGNAIFIGDTGGNSETAALISSVIQDNATTKLTIARDAVDLLVNEAELLLAQSNLTIVMSVSQLQKIARAVYYPSMVLLSFGVRPMAELLHKFTVTYRATVVLFHGDNLFVAKDGQVITQSFNQPLKVWNGQVAALAAAWNSWSDNPIEAVATSWTEL